MSDVMRGSRPAVQRSPTPPQSQTLVKTPWAFHQILRSLCESVSAFHRRATKQPVSQSSVLWRLDRRPAHCRMTKSKCNGGRRVSWLKFPLNKTLFVWLLFARLAMRQEGGGKKIHSTWCIHCFSAKHAPGPTAATATVQWPSPNNNSVPAFRRLLHKYVQHYMELFRITLSLSYAIKSLLLFFFKQLYIFCLAVSLSVKLTAGTPKDTNKLKLNFNTRITEVQPFCDAGRSLRGTRIKILWSDYCSLGHLSTGDEAKMLKKGEVAADKTIPRKLRQNACVTGNQRAKELPPQPNEQSDLESAFALTSIHFCASWNAESAADSVAGWCWWDAPMPATGLAIGEEALLSNCCVRVWFFFF